MNIATPATSPRRRFCSVSLLRRQPHCTMNPSIYSSLCRVSLKPLAGMAVLMVSAATACAQINARGSDSTLQVVKALAEAFQKESGTTVKLEEGGSGSGAKAVLAGEATLAFLSRDLKDSEKQAGLSGVPYAIDGVAVIRSEEHTSEL